MAPDCTKEGGERMSDYEILSIVLSLLTLVSGLLVALINKGK